MKNQCCAADAWTTTASPALAEEEGSSGQEFLTSIVVGCELVARAYLGRPSVLPGFRAAGFAGADNYLSH
jgi:hypothetical protein